MGSSTSESADVLIAGAGPAGSATAQLLARAGFRVVVADRAAFPRDKACADYLSPEALRMLEHLGVLGELEAHAVPLRAIRVTAARGSVLEGAFARAGITAPRPNGLCIPRRELDLRLVAAARAAGAVVLERSAVEDLVQSGSGTGGAVVRDLATGSLWVIRARLVVGADGLRSVVARRIGRRRHAGGRSVAFVAHLAGIDGPPGTAEMFVGAHGYAGLNPLPDGATNVALVVAAAGAGAARGAPEQFFRSRLAEVPGLGARVRSAPMMRRILVTGPFAARSTPVVADGVALVGDAAEFYDPFTGDGVCSALRGAAFLAEAAARALARPGPVKAGALRHYVIERRRAFGGKWAVERLIRRAMGFPRLFDRAVANAERRGLAHTLIGVAGESLPARAVLNPSFLARMVL